MNLQGQVSRCVTAVNTTQYITIMQSAGYTTDTDGTQDPAYTNFTNVPAQVQALSGEELRQVDGLNLQGIKQAVYIAGSWAGIVRKTGRGGDMLVINGVTWLVAMVLENWSDWTKLAVVQQID
jgi:hypothetical protein